jgi:hypothetical protein
VKISIFLSLGLDAAQLILYGTSMPKDRTFIIPGILLVGAKRAALTGLPHPYPFPYDIQTLLHFTLPVLRILLLVILFFALINPVVTYTTVTSADEVREDQPTSDFPPSVLRNTSTPLVV